MSKMPYIYALACLIIFPLASCKRSETTTSPDLQNKETVAAQEADKKQKREALFALMPQENLATLALQQRSRLGGMNTARVEFDTYPFSLGPTGIFATRAGKLKADRLYDPRANGKTSYVVTSIDKGSPAEGKISKGDVIVGANGKLFTDDSPDLKQSRARFPNPQMGMAIEHAEAQQGKLTLMVKLKDNSLESVAIQLKPLGALDPAGEASLKSEYLATVQADILLAHQNEGGGWGTGMKGKNQTKSRFIPSCMCALALMSTGDEKYTAAIKKAYNYIVATEIKSYQTWLFSYKSLFLTEYYLRYGDIRSKPAVQEMVNELSNGYFYYNGVYGYGHGLSGGNYRYGGINVCTAHAALTFAMGRILGCEFPNHMDTVMAKSLERIAPDGAMGYSWSIKRKGSTSAKRNENQCRTGISAVAYYYLGGRPEQYQTFLTYLLKNSEYADGGHATGGTLSWGASAMALAMADDTNFKSYLSSKNWQLAFNRRWDYGYYLQPSPHGQHRGADYLLGGDYVLATNTILFNRHKKNLIITGKKKGIPAVRPSYLTEVQSSSEYYNRKQKIIEVVEAINIMKECTPKVVYQHLERLKKIPLEASDYAEKVKIVYQHLPEVGRAVANTSMSTYQRNRALSALLGLNYSRSLRTRVDGTLLLLYKLQAPNQGDIEITTTAINKTGPKPRKLPRRSLKLSSDANYKSRADNFRTPFKAEQNVTFKIKIIWNGIQIDYDYEYTNDQKKYLKSKEGIRGVWSPKPWEMIQGPFYAELKVLVANGSLQVRYPDGNVFETSIMRNVLVHVNGKTMELAKYLNMKKGKPPLGQKIRFTYFLRDGQVGRPMCDSIYLSE